MMVRTAQEQSPTKARLLGAAQRLMLSKGFAATTVDEICEAAKLTKGCFFHYFESKDELGKLLLERFCACAQQRHASCCGTTRNPLQRVYNYIDGAIKLAGDPVMSQGCLLGAFAQELCDTHPAIRFQCAKGFREWAQQFGRELAQAKAAHAPRAVFDPYELAEHFIAVIEGALILGKTRRDTGVVVRSLRHFKAYVKSLVEGK